MKSIITAMTLAAVLVLTGCAGTGHKSSGFEQSISDAVGRAMEVESVTVTITFKPVEGEQGQEE